MYKKSLELNKKKRSLNIKSKDILFYDFDPKSFDIYYEKRNSIIVEHKAGTYVRYAGFKKDAIKVKVR